MEGKKKEMKRKGKKKIEEKRKENVWVEEKRQVKKKEG